MDFKFFNSIMMASPFLFVDASIINFFMYQYFQATKAVSEFVWLIN